MSSSVKKRGQKFVRRFSRMAARTEEEGREHIKENLIGKISNIGNIKLLIFEWGLLVSALILLATAQAFWFGSSYAENVFTVGGTYIEGTIGSVNSMNPLFATTSSEKVLSRLLFATLATNDYSGHPGIGLAESIHSTDDGKTWLVKLRDNITWSDGTPITNQDVIFTTDLIKNPEVNSIYDSNFTSITISETETGEISFSLPTPYADFISALEFPILPKHKLESVNPGTLIEDSFSNAPVTSGAFSFNALQPTSSDDEKIIYLSANPDYYKGKAMLNSFAIHTYEDKDELVKAVNAGTITATAELSGKDSEKISSNKFIVKNSSLDSGAFAFLNLKKETLKNADLRRAIRQGIDMAKVHAAAPDTIALDYPLLSSQITLSNYPALPQYNYDEAKAKIAEIIGDNQVDLEIATVTSSFLPEVTQVIAEELRGLGFNVNVSEYEENQEFITSVVSKRNYDILVYEIELGASPDLLPYYHSSQASQSGLNLSNYRDVLVDDLLLGARDTMDVELRAKKYESFLEHWVADVPAIGLYRPNLTYYYNQNAQTFSNNVSLVTPLDRFVDVTDWAVNKTTKNKTP